MEDLYTVMLFMLIRRWSCNAVLTVHYIYVKWMRGMDPAPVNPVNVMSVVVGCVFVILLLVLQSGNFDF